MWQYPACGSADNSLLLRLSGVRLSGVRLSGAKIRDHAQHRRSQRKLGVSRFPTAPGAAFRHERQSAAEKEPRKQSYEPQGKRLAPERFRQGPRLSRHLRVYQIGRAHV